MTSKHRFDLTLILCVSGCSNLEPIPELTCGNGVVEPEADEDCDGEEACEECRFVCEVSDCPAGFGCGVDGICRRASGRFEVAYDERGTTLLLRAHDLDGDARDDLLRITGEQVFIVFFDSQLAQAANASIDRHPANVSPVIADLTFDEMGEGDGLADVAVGMEFGATFGSGLGVFRLGADRSLTPSAYPTLPIAGDRGIAVPIRAVPPFSRDALMIFHRAGDRVELVAFDGGEERVILELPGIPIDPDTVSGFAAADVLLESPCEEVVFVHAGASRIDVVSPCSVGGDITWNRRPDVTTLWLPPGVSVQPTKALFAGDYEGDGDIDLFVLTTSTPSPVYLVENDAGLSSPRVLDEISAEAPSADSSKAYLGGCGDELDGSVVLAALADFNHDGAVDVVGSGAVYVSAGVGRYELVQSCLGWAEAVVADFDKNGHLDIAARRIDEPDIEIAFGAGDGAFTWTNVFTNEVVTSITAGDFDGDSVTDLGFADEGSVSVSFGASSGGFGETHRVGTPSAIHQITAGRVASDDAADDLIVVSERSDGTLSIAALSGSGSRQLVAPYVFDQGTGQTEVRAMAGGRFAATGPLGIAVVTTDRDGTTRLWRATVEGDADLSTVGSSVIGGEALALAAVDLDGDGIDEVVVFGDGASIYVPAPTGFSQKSTIGLEGLAFAGELLDPVIVDLDLDGAPDLVVRAIRGEQGEVIAFFNDGSGSVHLETAARISSEPESAFAVLNADDDDALEIIVGDELFDVARGDATASGDRLELPFAPETMTAGDFDGDGVDDLALGTVEGYAISRGVPVR